MKGKLLLFCFTSALSLSTLSERSNAQTPRLTCAALKGQQIPAASIGLPTRGAVVKSAKLTHLGAIGFCKVLGEIRSVDPAAQPIRFELNLPAQWNGKAVHYGGGGFDGTLATTNGLHTPEVGIKRDPTPLERGFATFGSDSGHHHHYLFLPDIFNSLQAGFAANPEQRLNFNHDGLKKTHDVALFLIAQHYGTRPKRTFFLGGSTGGREAYFVTQLWPADYDGVLGAYAGWNQVQLDLQFIRVSQAEYRSGDKFSRGWLPRAKTRLVASRVLDACDALDGVKDGIVSNVAACHFSLASLACPAGQAKASCLTPGELKTFQIFESEQRTDRPLAHGVQSISGFNVAAGTDLTGSLGLFSHPFRDPLFPFNSFYYVVANGVLRFFLTGDRHFSALHFDTATGGDYASGLLPQSVETDASDADLSAFAAHGGKFLMLHGTTDATIPTGASVQFYRMLEAKMGAAALNSFVRFYLVPGYGHGRGVFNAGIDALDVLDRWLDTGTGPQTIIATDNNKSQKNRTRPLCRYPEWPRYVSGDPDLAASFICTKPEAAPQRAESF